MRKIGVILFTILCISSCMNMWDTSSEDRITLEKEEKINKAKILEVITKNRNSQEEQERLAQKEKDVRMTETENKIYNELLSEDMNTESMEWNDSAKKILHWDVVINEEYDFDSDVSLLKFVNQKRSFTDIEYIPRTLENIAGRYVKDWKWNLKLRKEALYALRRLSEEFYLKFRKKLLVMSAYRSYTYQKKIKDNGCADVLCAKAGYSEHQSWLAVDLWEASDNKSFLLNKKLKEYFEWMNEEAHKYGFINTYQKWIDVDWYEKEPWHWRYVWIDFAEMLNSNGMTLAEFHNVAQ